MARFNGPDRTLLDQLIASFEQLVERILTRVAKAAANLLGGTASTVPADHVHPDDLNVIRTIWDKTVDGELVPALERVFETAAGVTAQGASKAASKRRRKLAKQQQPAVEPTVEDIVAAITAPPPEAFMRDARNRLVGIGDQLWQHTREELAQGIEAGDDMRRLAARVQAAAGVTGPRAMVIARTEVVAANNAASLAQARMLGNNVIKEWLATNDLRTRPAHKEADGQRRKINDKFEVGGLPLAFPGDPTGPPDLVVACRCSLAFDVDDDALDEALTAAVLVAARSGYDEEHDVKRDTGGKFAKVDTRGERGLVEADAGYVAAAGDATPWIHENVMALTFSSRGAGHGDGSLAEIVDHQFPGMPQVGTRSDVDEAIDGGWAEIWRGSPSVESVAALRTSPDFTPGTGLYGNGIYGSTSIHTATSFAKGGPRVRMAVNPKAKTVTYNDLLKEMRAFTPPGGGSPLLSKMTSELLSDPGRFAAARGYDAIFVTGERDGGYDPSGQPVNADQFVVLNRSVLLIEDSDR